MPVPLSAAHFLGEVPKWARGASAIARGVGGLELWRQTLETPPSRVPPDPVEPRSAVAVREFAIRTWPLFSYEARGGRRCFGVETTFASGSPPPWNRAGGHSFRCVDAAEVGALSMLGPDLWPSVRGSGAVVSMSGVVTADVQTVEVELADGSTRSVPVLRGAFLYLSDPGEPPPVRAIVHGADSVVLAAERLR